MTHVAENVTVAAKIREYVVERAAYRKYSHSAQKTAMEASWIPMPANIMFRAFRRHSGTGAGCETATSALDGDGDQVEGGEDDEVEVSGDGAVALAVLGY